MNCAMCPSWMSGGMVLATVIGVLLVILLVLVIVKLGTLRGLTQFA